MNALVFAGILVAVLAAIEVADRFRPRRPELWYVALLASLAVAWLVPASWLLSLPWAVRLAVAIVVAFLPVFFANVIFAQRFRDVSSSTTAFGANLLGAMLGGVLEYVAIVSGYASLLLVAAILYGLAFLFGRSKLVADPGPTPAAEPTALTGAGGFWRRIPSRFVARPRTLGEDLSVGLNYDSRQVHRRARSPMWSERVSRTHEPHKARPGRPAIDLVSEAGSSSSGSTSCVNSSGVDAFLGFTVGQERRHRARLGRPAAAQGRPSSNLAPAAGNGPCTSSRRARRIGPPKTFPSPVRSPALFRTTSPARLTRTWCGHHVGSRGARRSEAESAVVEGVADRSDPLRLPPFD